MPSRGYWIVIIGLVTMLVLAVGPVAAGGGGLGEGVRTGESISIGAGEVVSHDLLVFGGNLVMDGTIEGDLVAAAGTVTINGTVAGDLVAGSGQVRINGEVTGDVRAGAGELSVSGTVGEDLAAGAGQLTIEEGGEIGGNLVFAAGNVLMNGTVTGDIRGRASSYEINGSVGGTENVTLETGGGWWGDPWAPDPSQPAPSEPMRIAGDALVQFVTVVFLGAIGLLAVPGALRASESALRRRPLASAGIGVGVIVGYIIQFIAVILLMILLGIAFSAAALESLGGIAVWLGLIALLITTFALVVSAAFLVDVVVGLALARLVTRDWAQNRWQELVLLVGGAVVVVLVTSLPGVGGIAKLVVIVLGLGAMGVALGEWWTRRHPPQAPAWTSAGAPVASPDPVGALPPAAPAAAPAVGQPGAMTPAATEPTTPATETAPEPAAATPTPKRTRRKAAAPSTEPPTEPPPDSTGA